jgi:aspartate aminotransferase
MSISTKMHDFMTKASWIRKMFEEGMALKAMYGPDNVYDFSLGNPDLPPPASFRQSLLEAVNNETPNCHSYMPNAGYTEVRQAIARHLSSEHGLLFSAQDIIMTCGAAGALNVILKAILNPGDEVIIPAPYFVEYNFYIDNPGGKPVIVRTKDDFSLNLPAIEEAITSRTKAVLINSPNNPTGQIYDQDSIRKLGELLADKTQERGQTIYLIADEPYRYIVYDGIKAPGVFAAYRESIVATSHSKDLSLPGERIGYIAVHPEGMAKDDLVSAMTLANRILGFVNAPALMQRVVAGLQGQTVDTSIYQKRRDMLCEALAGYGYQFLRPKGAFYLFPRSPFPDDTAFVKVLQEQNILTVPGSGFGCPGYFRIAYCVPEKTIERALPGFEMVMARYLDK